MAFHISPAGLVQNPNAISTVHPEAGTGTWNVITYSAPSAATWSSANRSFYIPFQIARPMVVTSFFYPVSSASGSVDLGIADVAGTLLVSTGNTGTSGSSTITRIGIADYTLPSAGTYFMAMAADNTSLSVPRWGTATYVQQAAGVCMVDSNFPLASQTLSASSLTTAAYLPVFGFLTKDIDP